MSRRAAILAIVLAAVTGLCLLAYPVVSNYVYARNATTAVLAYDDTVAETAEDALAQAREEAAAYNDSLAGNPAADPFLAESGMALPGNYAEMLRVGDSGAMGYIAIPKLALRQTLWHGTADATLRRSIGHLEGSSLPVGGEGSHSVIVGHSGLSHAKMFTDLEKLEEGDLFYLHVLGEVLAYRVDLLAVVEPDEVEGLQRVPGKDYCTLVTCTPYGVNSHRLLVRGLRMEYAPEVEEELMKSSAAAVQWFSWRSTLIGLAAGAAATGAILLALFIIQRRRRRWQKRGAYWWNAGNG